uniref:Uncharacterized protein n=1 Tax=Kalanchoe fedtschenkoi TaxID=63787 RepID=A0A7N0VLX2_KALFE
MAAGDRMGWPPTVSPPLNWQKEDPHWRHFDNSVNAVSFGFVATAILIAMFLVMAVFERFIRPPGAEFVGNGGGPGSRHRRADLEARGELERKLAAAPPSPKMHVYAREVSVLMPGENLPTFIAQPAPAPCPPERVQWHLHQHQHCIPSPSRISISSPVRITSPT